jgi:hypothetical protein
VDVCGGWGGGVVDRLKENGHETVAFNGSEHTDMRTHDNEFGFNNTRSAAWWNVRELLDPSNSATTLMLPDDEYLIADLTSPKWRVAPGAKIVVEEKAETKKRLRRSPDTGDSVVMNLWLTGVDQDWSISLPYGGQSEFVVPYADSKDSAYTAGTSVFDDVLASYGGFTDSRWS